ncbi:copia-like polyprotein [Lentinula edodes]|uniref:Copia-like polyprotein n=1 Tax=Lentinula edodes TaxID=5353 RepID=A0A1Q3EAG3_LENED|nr:copia-like polyprotein [Lentinula edodes]
MFIHQMDVKSAYLYGKLDDNEQIYMKAPPGVDIEVKAGQVLKLKLALYGLKQAGLAKRNEVTIELWLIAYLVFLQIQPVEGEDQDLGNLETSITESEQPIIPVPEEIAEPINPDIITGKRVRKPTKKIQDIINGLGEPNRELRHLTASLGQVTGEIIADPTSVAEAMRRPDWSQWREAMNEEIRRLQQRGTYDIVIPPDDANILTSKWIPDVDYFPDETFASVTKLAAARAILSTGAEQNMFIHQMDVKSAYLYSKLDDNEQIYMKAPPGVDIEVKAGQVLKLKLALYGLKQAGRRWYMRFREIMTSVGLTRSNFDHAIFYRTDPFCIIFIHVDDMTMLTKTMAVMDTLKKKIRDQIEVVDSGEIHWANSFSVGLVAHVCDILDGVLALVLGKMYVWIDYFPDETFASVTKLAAARAILSIGAEQNMFIHQMDVKSAYLYGKLDDNEQIYMKAPPGVDIEVKAGQVLKLKLALYGLKQAGRRWYMRFREIMTSVGLTFKFVNGRILSETGPFFLLISYFITFR